MHVVCADAGCGRHLDRAGDSATIVMPHPAADHDREADHDEGGSRRQPEGRPGGAQFRTAHRHG